MIELIASDTECKRYRLVAPPTNPKWAAEVREGQEPWCEFSVWTGGRRLGSYGGEVWPSAWPEWFLHTPNRYNGGAGFTLTDAGALLLNAAVSEQEVGG